MRPALHAVVAVLEGGRRWPEPAQVAAMLQEAEVDAGEARELVQRYAAARPGTTTQIIGSEQTLLASLRSFSLRH